jgi:hypothetical protein
VNWRVRRLAIRRNGPIGSSSTLVNRSGLASTGRMKRRTVISVGRSSATAARARVARGF